jgi:hypothetical protein
MSVLDELDILNDVTVGDWRRAAEGLDGGAVDVRFLVGLNLSIEEVVRIVRGLEECGYAIQSLPVQPGRRSGWAPTTIRLRPRSRPLPPSESRGAEVGDLLRSAAAVPDVSWKRIAWGPWKVELDASGEGPMLWDDPAFLKAFNSRIVSCSHEQGTTRWVSVDIDVLRAETARYQRTIAEGAKEGVDLPVIHLRSEEGRLWFEIDGGGHKDPVEVTRHFMGFLGQKAFWITKPPRKKDLDANRVVVTLH